MSYLDAIVLSIVEGLTEFLPISSTGHLVLTSNLFAIQQTSFVKSFEIFIQLGAILAVVFLYKTSFIRSIEVWKRITIAFIPTGIVGFLLYKILKNFLLGNILITLIALFFGGILLILLEYWFKGKNHPAVDLKEIPLKTAFFIGLIQSISIIPGVSRAAATIIGGRFLGLDKKTAVEFSFLLAVPTIAAATGLDLMKSSFAFSSSEILLLGIGCGGSFLIALVTIKFFLRFIKQNSFVAFGIYRVIFSLMYFLLIH